VRGGAAPSARHIRARPPTKQPTRCNRMTISSDEACRRIGFPVQGMQLMGSVSRISSKTTRVLLRGPTHVARGRSGPQCKTKPAPLQQPARSDHAAAAHNRQPPAPAFDCPKNVRRTSGRHASCCSGLPDSANAIEQMHKVAAEMRIVRINILLSFSSLPAVSNGPFGFDPGVRHRKRRRPGQLRQQGGRNGADRYFQIRRLDIFVGRSRPRRPGKTTGCQMHSLAKPHGPSDYGHHL
jgi:hypothetical protein